MTRDELMTAVETAKIDTKNALQTVYDALNQGQKSRLSKMKLLRLCLTCMVLSTTYKNIIL